MHIVVDTQGTDRELEEGGCKKDGSIAAMHIVVDTQGTDRELEEGGCKRDSSIAEQPCTL